MQRQLSEGVLLKGIPEILQSSQADNCVGVSFLIKLQTSSRQLY